MEAMSQDSLDLWREQGSEIIPKKFKTFRSLVAQAKKYAEQNNYEIAAVYGEMAALYATCQHCGCFVSHELEQILLIIGKKTVPNYPMVNGDTVVGKPNKILHVATSVQAISGHSKMLERWIQQDRDRSHSLVLTRQPRKEVPTTLKDVVTGSGGKIYKLNETIGSLITWAKQLRKIAATVDLVVLHIHNYDVIPMLAFSNKQQLPPIIFLDHADHLFWLGAGISDFIINLRESGLRLSQQRRGIEPERIILLPTILAPIERTFSRAEAKKQIGVPADKILLLSIARGIKYKPVNRMSYADAHVQLLKKYQQATLVVIGPGGQEDWSDAIQETQGRITVYPERQDTAIFYQAADIYVDSFPFVSTTSLLEAGSYSVPLVSRFPYTDASAIFGAEMPGLVGNLIISHSLEEYTAALSHLIEDESFRLTLGEVTRKKIADVHWGINWQSILENIYDRVVTLPEFNTQKISSDEMFLGEPDILMPHVHGGFDFCIDDLIQSHLTIMPLDQRLYHWVKLVKKYGLSNSFGRLGQFRFLVPEWVYYQYVRWRYG